jgi:cell division septum initiation protein DivIVA
MTIEELQKENESLRQQVADCEAEISGHRSNMEWMNAKLQQAEADKKRLVELAKGNITGCGTCYTIIKEANLPEGAPRH